MSTRKERLFAEHNTRLKKIASVFAFKSRGTIEPEEFYQEFAVRLLELNTRYKKMPLSEFTKILNFSLHNLAVDILRARFRIFYVADVEGAEGEPLAEDSTLTTVMVPSFLYFYRQAALKLIHNAKAAEVFDWLICNPDVVERIRDEKNLKAIRKRRAAFRDIVEAISDHFEVVPNVARGYIRVIKNSLKQVWVLEGGV